MSFNFHRGRTARCPGCWPEGFVTHAGVAKLPLPDRERREARLTKAQSPKGGDRWAKRARLARLGVAECHRIVAVTIAVAARFLGRPRQRLNWFSSGSRSLGSVPCQYGPSKRSRSGDAASPHRHRTPSVPHGAIVWTSHCVANQNHVTERFGQLTYYDEHTIS